MGRSIGEERAQTTLWLLVICVVVVLCVAGVMAVGGRSVRAGRYRSAADLVALAAVHRDEGVAAVVASDNDVRLRSVRWIDDSTVVIVVETPDGDTLSATAEAEVRITQ